MFVHKKCGEELRAKATIIEYAPIWGFDSLGGVIYDCDDVFDSDVVETIVYCQSCDTSVSRDEVKQCLDCER